MVWHGMEWMAWCGRQGCAMVEHGELQHLHAGVVGDVEVEGPVGSAALPGAAAVLLPHEEYLLDTREPPGSLARPPGPSGRRSGTCSSSPIQSTPHIAPSSASPSGSGLELKNRKQGDLGQYSHVKDVTRILSRLFSCSSPAAWPWAI